MEIEHLQAIFYGGSVGSSALHEERLDGVIDKVEEQVVRPQGLVGKVGTGVRVRVHAQRRTVDDEGIVADGVGRDVSVGELPRTGRTAHLFPTDAQAVQGHTHSLGGTPRTQHQSLAMVRLEQGAQAVGEADDVAVEARQVEVTVLTRAARDAHHVDSPYLARRLIEFVQVGDDGLLVGNGTVQTTQVGMLAHDIDNHPAFGNLKVEVGSISAVLLKSLGEKPLAETMSQRVSYQSVLFHYFSAKYMVQMPKVKRFHSTLRNPALRRMPSMTSPWGKASMVAGRYR